MEWQAAEEEAKRLELGNRTTSKFLESRLSEVQEVYGDNTVLIGGPPCQAYSLAGRVRNAAVAGYLPHKDDRNVLYEKHIEVLELLEPAFFVMENVKGMLSGSVRGEGVFKTRPRCWGDFPTTSGPMIRWACDAVRLSGSRQVALRFA